MTRVCKKSPTSPKRAPITYKSPTSPKRAQHRLKEPHFTFHIRDLRTRWLPSATSRLRAHVYTRRQAGFGL